MIAHIMKSRAHLLTIALCVAGCARRSDVRVVVQPEEGENSEILVGKEAFEEGPQVLGAWMAYGLGKLKAYQEHPPPPANESADDFTLELAARDVQADIWTNMRKDGSAPANASLDRLVDIRRAGLL